jgi:prepilin peptidase CpaA
LTLSHGVITAALHRSESRMTISSTASVLACVTFVAAMAHVVVTDFRYARIRNWVVAALAAAYLPLALAAGLPWISILTAFAAGLAVFAAGFGAFAAGWVGGGDVKLAAVVALWLGAEQTAPFLLCASIFGGALALALMAVGALLPRNAAAAVPGGEQSRLALPYGPALALAGVLLLRSSPWAGAL